MKGRDEGSIWVDSLYQAIEQHNSTLGIFKMTIDVSKWKSVNQKKNISQQWGKMVMKIVGGSQYILTENLFFVVS